MHNMNRVQMLEFSQRGDDRGHLVIVEGKQDIPFEIKRAFYIYGSDEGVIRGQHANRKTEFVLINVAGKSKVKVKDGEGNEAKLPVMGNEISKLHIEKSLSWAGFWESATLNL